MILIASLRIANATEQRRGVERHEPDKSLHDEERVDGETEAGVHRREVLAVVGSFVVDDNGEPAEQGEDAQEVEGGVRVGADALLSGGVGGLEEEDGLGDEEEPG